MGGVGTRQFGGGKNNKKTRKGKKKKTDKPVPHNVAVRKTAEEFYKKIHF